MHAVSPYVPGHSKLECSLELFLIRDLTVHYLRISETQLCMQNTKGLSPLKSAILPYMQTDIRPRVSASEVYLAIPL